MITPPIGRIVDTSRQRCSYSPGDTDANDCGQPATWHIAWDTDLENGLACDQHMAYAQQFAYLDRHPVSADCAMPGTAWHFELKRCIGPGQDVAAEAHAVLATPAGDDDA